MITFIRSRLVVIWGVQEDDHIHQIWIGGYLGCTGGWSHSSDLDWWLSGVYRRMITFIRSRLVVIWGVQEDDHIHQIWIGGYLGCTGGWSHSSDLDWWLSGVYRRMITFIRSGLVVIWGVQEDDHIHQIWIGGYLGCTTLSFSFLTCWIKFLIKTWSDWNGLQDHPPLALGIQWHRLGCLCREWSPVS